MAAHQARSPDPSGRGLSGALHDQLGRTYADGNHVNLRSVIASAGLAGNDDWLADLIDADARLRLKHGLEVDLPRYLEAMPDLPMHPAALDTAIEMSLRGLCTAGQTPEQATEALVVRFPQFTKAIRTASVLADLMCSTDGLHLSLAKGGRTLPQEFGPMLRDKRRRYELRELLGAGAHGAVYLAVDRQLSDRDRPAWVAIKVMGAMSDGDEGRLTDEATKARRVDHRNVVRVLDRGVTEEGEPFLAYEYVRGGDLAAHTSAMSGPMGAREAAALVAKVAGGLGAAHAAGLAHCDLKPANVVITEGGEPKIADFGVAVRLGGRDPKSVYQRLGSMAFVAPEQFRGEEGALSPLADIYAAGGLLFWLLTRKFPNGESPAEVERNLAGPSRRSEPPELGEAGRVDPDLAAICRRALHPDPKRRYASADAMAQDLESWLRYEPLRWTRTSPVRHARLLAKRQPMAVMLTGMLALVLLVGAGGGMYARQRAIMDKAQAEHKRLQQAVAMLDSALNVIETFRGNTDDWMPIMTVIETIVGPALAGEADVPDMWRSRINRIRDLLASAKAQGRENELEPMLWETVLGYWLVRSGKVDEAEPMLQSNRERWARRVDPGDPWLREIDAILGCASARRAMNSRDHEKMSRAAAALESIMAAGPGWKDGKLVRHLVALTQADLYAPEGLDDPGRLRAAQAALRGE